ncbi:MAG: hypothetical protein R2827_06090 [Bdellovibrionales bacterium]
MSLRIILILLSLGLSRVLWAQPSIDEAATGISQQGQLFTIKLVPGDKSLKLYVVGNEAAEVRKSIYGVEASVFVGDEVKTLVVTPNSDHYIISRPKNSKELNLRLRSTSETFEDFKVPLPNP